MIKVDDFKSKIIMTIRKYYATLLLIIFATIGMMIMIQKGYNGVDINESNIKLILTLIYGAIVSLIIKDIICRLYEKNKLYNLLYLLIPILMVIVYFIILNDINVTSQLLKYFILCLLSGILYFVIPFIDKKEDSDYYSYKIMIGLALTGICYWILNLGIFFTIQSISVLFEISIKEYMYMEIAVFILGFIMPTFFLTSISGSELEKKEYPNFIKKVLMYIIFPILSVYTIVLYAYFIKILLELKWPSNILGNLVIYYSLISIVVLYFANKIKNENKWSNNFIKIYPYMLIIPICMMATSFIVRISEYGLTEARYYALMCFIFVMISIFIIKFKNKVKYIPVLLSVLLFISTFGPQSAMNLSRLSQEKRLEKILIDNNMLEDNKIVKNANLKEEEKEKIINIIEYFQNSHSIKDIDLLPKNFEISNMEETFGFSYNNFSK